MKYRVSLLLAASVTLFASSAMAAPVFMLQFGSFETRAEADTRLNDLRTKHAGVLGAMQTGIREVTLPPDNLTVYRTQAGPVNTRSDAQSVCSQLASNGDECYVVETAMMAPMTPATTQVTQAAPAPQAAMMAAPTAAPMVTTPATSAPITVGAAAASSSLPSLPESGAPQQAPAPVAMTAIPTRDPNNVAAIARVSAAPAAPMAPPVATMNAEMDQAASQQQLASDQAMESRAASADMRAAMDQAAAEQDAAMAQAPTPPGAQQEGSFWSRLNPFSSDQAPAPAPAPVAAPKLETAPVEPIDSVSTMPAPPAPIAPAAPGLPSPAVLTGAPQPPVTELAAPAPVLAPITEAPAPADAPIVIGTPMDTSPMAAPSPLLPPPPAPTNAADRAAFDAGRVPEPLIAQNAPAPMGAPQAAPFQNAETGNANVRVGEAQRVPLSQTPQLPPPVMAAPMAAPMPQAVPAVSLHPNATLGQKTLWAQIGMFDDAQAALAFWEQYRNAHPDFPVVRVRVATPYQAMTRGNDRVTLRVGPFAKSGAINNLCATMPDDGLRCGMVTDMGIASGGGTRKGYLPGSRYSR